MFLSRCLCFGYDNHWIIIIILTAHVETVTTNAASRLNIYEFSLNPVSFLIFNCMLDFLPQRRNERVFCIDISVHTHNMHYLFVKWKSVSMRHILGIVVICSQNIFFFFSGLSIFNTFLPMQEDLYNFVPKRRLQLSFRLQINILVVCGLFVF